MKEVAARPGMLFHSVLDRTHKRYIAAACREQGIAACDLTGPFVAFIAEHSGLSPVKDYQRLHHVDEAYSQRIHALEFALAHDDALGLETLEQADVVLAGVSWTSKTPTSIYLAQQGYRVANVSLALELGPPPELLAITEKKTAARRAGARPRLTPRYLVTPARLGRVGGSDGRSPPLPGSG